MNILKKIMGLSLLILLCISNTMGSSYCKHSFVIHGKTVGDRGLFFFDVLRGGECEGKESFILSLEPEKSNIWLRNADYYESDSISTVLSELNMEEKVSLKDSAGFYALNNSALVTLPVYDSTFKKKFVRLYDQGPCDAKHWNSACPVNCKDLPQFKRVNAELIYTYPGGIYKNYTFSEVIYFPKSNYLVVVTYQPLEAIGGDTNHGLLIFHLD